MPHNLTCEEPTVGAVAGTLARSTQEALWSEIRYAFTAIYDRTTRKEFDTELKALMQKVVNFRKEIMCNGIPSATCTNDPPVELPYQDAMALSGVTNVQSELSPATNRHLHGLYNSFGEVEHVQKVLEVYERIRNGDRADSACTFVARRLRDRQRCAALRERYEAYRSPRTPDESCEVSERLYPHAVQAFTSSLSGANGAHDLNGDLKRQLKRGRNWYMLQRLVSPLALALVPVDCTDSKNSENGLERISYKTFKAFLHCFAAGRSQHIRNVVASIPVDFFSILDMAEDTERMDHSFGSPGSLSTVELASVND